MKKKILLGLVSLLVFMGGANAKELDYSKMLSGTDLILYGEKPRGTKAEIINKTRNQIGSQYRSYVSGDEPGSIVASFELSDCNDEVSSCKIGFQPYDTQETTELFEGKKINIVWKTSEAFKKIAPNFEFRIGAVKPDIPKTEEEEKENFYAIESMSGLRIQALLGEEYYGGIFECNDDYVTCDLTVSKFNENYSESHPVKIIWESGSVKAKTEIEKYANKILSKMTSSDNSESKWVDYELRDLFLINYMANYSDTNPGSAGDYAPDLKAEFDNSNVEYKLDVRLGDAGPFWNYVGGMLTLIYNGVMYETLNPNYGHVGISQYHILYIPDDTENTAEAFAAAAKKRIDEYFIGTVPVKVEVAGLRSKFAAENAFDFSELGDESKMSDSYYKITIREKSADFVIIKDSSKIEKPVTITKDIDTNVSVTTTSSEVPLDTKITVNEVKKDSEDHKTIVEVIKTEVFQAFDISLFSASKNSNITKLENGLFKVTVPVKEELKGKDLYAYYIKEDKTLEEHKVTLDEKGNATFETNHFSTYIISEKIEAKESGEKVPATGDNIMTYVGVGIVAILEMLGSAIILSKKTN